MPKGKKRVDDLEDELENEEEAEEEEEGTEEETEEDADEETDGEEEAEDGEEDEDEKPAKRKAGRPKGSGAGKDTRQDTIKKGKLIGVVLRGGIPKRVQIIKVMGRNVKATKVGEKDVTKSLRIPISDVFEYEEAIYEKMQLRAEKIQRLIDANISDATNRLRPIAAPRTSVRTGDPMQDW